MKTLADGNEVTARSYYFLLDWNERNSWIFIAESFGKERLCNLTLPEYKKLWMAATTNELKSMGL